MSPAGSDQSTTPVGFEPTRGDPIGLAGRRLNHSAKVSLGRCMLIIIKRCQCVQLKLTSHRPLFQYPLRAGVVHTVEPMGSTELRQQGRTRELGCELDQILKHGGQPTSANVDAALLSRRGTPQITNDTRANIGCVSTSWFGDARRHVPSRSMARGLWIDAGHDNIVDTYNSIDVYTVHAMNAIALRSCALCGMRCAGNVWA